MKVFVIKGTLEALGPGQQTPRGGTLYKYLSFVSEDGTQVRTRNTSVHPEIDSAMAPGSSGTFIVARQQGFVGVVFGGFTTASELVAAKFGERELTAPVISSPGKIYLQMFFGLIISIPFMFVLVGIPLFFLFLTTLFTMPGNRSKIVRTARESGFSLKQRAVTI